MIRRPSRGARLNSQRLPADTYSDTTVKVAS